MKWIDINKKKPFNGDIIWGSDGENIWYGEYEDGVLWETFELNREIDYWQPVIKPKLPRG